MKTALRLRMAGHTYREIGAALGKTGESARRLVNQAIQRYKTVLCRDLIGTAWYRSAMTAGFCDTVEAEIVAAYVENYHRRREGALKAETPPKRG